MMHPDATKRLTARQALNNFQKIYSSLSKSELNTQVVNLFWDNGRFHFIILEICHINRAYLHRGSNAERELARITWAAELGL
jgi:hypothetical protein